MYSLLDNKNLLTFCIPLPTFLFDSNSKLIIIGERLLENEAEIPFNSLL